MSGFDRIRDPRTSAGPGSGGQARRAMFTEAAPSRGPRLHCTRCATPTPLRLSALARVGLTGWVVLPWRAAPVHAVCPACRHRTWLEFMLH